MLKSARLAFLMLCCGLGVSAWSQAPTVMNGAYTCIDAKGRRLTADRPIAECADREQRVLNPSGTVQARITPVPTAAERAAQEEKNRQAAAEQQRAAEEKRKEKALLIRFPNKAAHDKERADQLAKTNAAIEAATLRSEELTRTRVKIDAEMEFYKKDPSKAPAYLRRQLEENTQNQTIQKGIVLEQNTALRGIHVHFDDELIRLRQLWGPDSK